MQARDRGAGAAQPTSALFGVVLPVAVLLVVIAIVSGLVFGGVLQGQEERLGPEGTSTTRPTIIIEP